MIVQLFQHFLPTVRVDSVHVPHRKRKTIDSLEQVR